MTTHPPDRWSGFKSLGLGVLATLLLVGMVIGEPPLRAVCALIAVFGTYLVFGRR